MPLNNPSVINKATRADGEYAPICDECALRLLDGDDANLDNCYPVDEWLHGENCLECLAFSERRHPAMLSTVSQLWAQEAGCE